MDTKHAFRHAFLPFVIALATAVPFAAHAAGEDPWPLDAGNGMAMQDADVAFKPGQFEWHPERAAAGQLVMVVSLPAQMVHVYRNGVRIGVSTISSGKPGKETPTGTFEILQKKEMHHSNLYNNAPMPFMQRLTWDGIALHAGKLPGYPASHGCVRLPSKFAELLYGETRKGMLVVVADEASHGPEVLYPGSRAPVDAYTGQALDASAIAAADTRATEVRAVAALPE